MKKFMDKDFMLQNETAVKLYHEHAAKMPIIDYHCHLSPQMIYEDKPFDNITQIFLGGDHYKWRYMRSMGLDESYMTGDKPDAEKFKAFCSVLQYAIGNPLYHWTHLELQRYFGIDTIVRKDTWEEIWNKANAVIKETQMSPSKLIKASNVEIICTTDDPADSLEWHKKIAEKGHISAKVVPAFRPDFMLNIDKDTYVPYIAKLAGAAGMDINSYADMIEAVYKRIEFFHENGCRVSDHALDGAPYAENIDVEAVFKKAMNGEKLTKEEIEGYKSSTLIALAKKYTELDWCMQLHIGALRNNNTRMFNKLGADTGFDSIADYSIAEGLSKLLNAMEMTDNLPKTILYTLNP